MTRLLKCLETKQMARSFKAMKTVPIKDLSTLKMVAGGEKKHPIVIHNGMMKQ